MKSRLLALMAATLLLPAAAAAQDVTVPDLRVFRGVSEMQAALTHAGLRGRFVEGSVAPTPDLTHRVMSQHPGPNTRVPRDTTVTVTVYKAPCPPMPNLVGLSFDAAVGFIDQCGLVVGGVEIEAAPSPDSTGKISFQDPPAGTPITKGMPVRLKRYMAGNRAAGGGGGIVGDPGAPVGARSACERLPADVKAVFHAQGNDGNFLVETMDLEDSCQLSDSDSDDRATMTVSITKHESVPAARQWLRQELGGGARQLAIGDEGYVETNVDDASKRTLSETVTFIRGLYVVRVLGYRDYGIARAQAEARKIDAAMSTWK